MQTVCRHRPPGRLVAPAENLPSASGMPNRKPSWILPALIHEYTSALTTFTTHTRSFGQFPSRYLDRYSQERAFLFYATAAPACIPIAIGGLSKHSKRVNDGLALDTRRIRARQRCKPLALQGQPSQWDLLSVARMIKQQLLGAANGPGGPPRGGQGSPCASFGFSLQDVPVSRYMRF